MGEAIRDYDMIREGDKVIVAVSGGKDSIVLLSVLEELRRSAPVTFELVPVHVKTGFEQGFEDVADWFKKTQNVAIQVLESGIDAIIKEKADPDKSPCALCSRLRRGVLYSFASQIQANSIALGHHLDDIVETFFLRCFFTGQLGAMSPERISDDGRNRIIRPMAYVTADIVQNFFTYLEVAPVRSFCPIRKDGRRQMVREHIKELEKTIPMVKHSIFAALGNIDEKSLCLPDGVKKCAL